MNTIDLIIYLGRVKSAIEDMQALQDHEVPFSTVARVDLQQVHAALLTQIKAAPDHTKYVTFGDLANV